MNVRRRTQQRCQRWEIDEQAREAERIFADPELSNDNTPRWIIAGIVLSIISGLCSFAAFLMAE